MGRKLISRATVSGGAEKSSVVSLRQRNDEACPGKTPKDFTQLTKGEEREVGGCRVEAAASR
jgi:hypothetical protein